MCGWAFLLTNAGGQVLQFSGLLIDLLSILLRCNGFARIQKALMDQTVSRPPNSDYDLFLVQVWLWEMLWSFFSVQPLSWSLQAVIQNRLFIAHQIQTIHCSLLSHKIRRWHFKMTFLKKITVSSWGTHLLSFFTFPICFKCQMIIERLTVNSLATSRVVVRESASVSALNWSLSTSNGRLLHSSSSRLSFPLQNFLTTTAL